MDAIDAEELARTPLRTDAQIAERVALLIGRARRRQLWLLLLDDRQTQLPVLMPVEGTASPIGADFVRGLTALLARTVAETPAGAAIVVWERPGGPIASAADRADAAALAWALADAGVPVRAQLISHDHGVRLFGAEEYAIGAEALPGSVEP